MQELTKKQWNDKGFKLKETAKGVLGWNNCFYNFKVLRYCDNEVEQMTDEEFASYKKEKNHKAYLKRKERAKWKKRLDEFFVNLKGV